MFGKMKLVEFSVILILTTVEHFPLVSSKPLDNGDVDVTQAELSIAENPKEVQPIRKIRESSEITKNAGGGARAEPSSTTNPLAGLQNLFGNGIPGNPLAGSSNTNQAGVIPPILVLGMHQAILVPLNSMPDVFQNMLTGMLPFGNSQQNNNIVSGIPNLTG